MKILRVIPTMNPTSGGPCQGIRNTIPELRNLGIENEVVSLDDPYNSQYNDTFLLHALGPTNNPWAYNAKLVPWLMENMSRFDAIIVHGMWLYPGYAVWKAVNIFKNQNKPRPKIFLMPHGMLDPYFQRANSRKLKAIRNWIYWKIIEAKVVNGADGLLYTCDSELLLARETFTPFHPAKEMNIGYGISNPPIYSEVIRNAFYHECSEVMGDSFILFLSRIHEKKGLRILLKAYEKILKEKIESKNPIPKLVIAGPGWETSFGQELIKIINQNKIFNTWVFRAGMLTGNAKWGAFYESDAVILPSHQENFGIAVVEALACYKPVLISNKVNIYREIEKGQGGLVTEDTESGIYDLLSQWLDTPSRVRQKMKKNAYNIFKNHFTNITAAKNLIEHIENHIDTTN